MTAVRSHPARPGRGILLGAVLIAALGAVSGCSGTNGPDAPDVRMYDKTDTRIEVEPGQRFAIALEENASTGYVWTISEPGPDAEVVEKTGERTEGGPDENVGSGGEKVLDFRALSEGRTELRLRHCFRCGTPDEQIDENHKVEELTFDVYVQD